MMVEETISNEYLDTAFSACITLRKVRNLIIEQNNENYRMRAQLHIFLCSPFGTFKSTLLKRVRYILPKETVYKDDFTKASLEGSITKSGDYVPSIVTEVGGKILLVDEWNNVSYDGQSALLGLLENQTVARNLGFTVRTPFRRRNKYMNFKIEENRITGEAFFSCISFAMEYPTEYNKQKSLALLSRYTPIFIEPDIEFIKAVTRGLFILKIEDYSANIDNIYIPKKVYDEFHTKYYEYMETGNLVPDESEVLGFVSRCLAELVRLGAYNYLRQNKPQESNVTIDDSRYFVEMFPYIDTIMRNFDNPRTNNKFEQYKKIRKEKPMASNSEYARLLGVTRMAITYYNSRLQES